MKSGSKSATIRVVTVIFSLLVLGGCADSKWPSWFTGEPDDSVLNAPRLVGKPSPQDDEEWPYLGMVPVKPKNISTPQSRAKSVKRMTTDQEAAEQIRQRAARDPLLPATGAQPGMSAP